MLGTSSTTGQTKSKSPVKDAIFSHDAYIFIIWIQKSFGSMKFGIMKNYENSSSVPQKLLIIKNFTGFITKITLYLS